MPDRERRILELRYYEELSQDQIAKRVGISQMHVSRLLRRVSDVLASAGSADRTGWPSHERGGQRSAPAAARGLGRAIPSRWSALTVPARAGAGRWHRPSGARRPRGVPLARSISWASSCSAPRRPGWSWSYTSSGPQRGRISLAGAQHGTLRGLGRRPPPALRGRRRRSRTHPPDRGRPAPDDHIRDVAASAALAASERVSDALQHVGDGRFELRVTDDGIGLAVFDAQPQSWPTPKDPLLAPTRTGPRHRRGPDRCLGDRGRPGREGGVVRAAPNGRTSRRGWQPTCQARIHRLKRLLDPAPRGEARARTTRAAGSVGRDDVDDLAALALAELHRAVDEGEQRVVAADADVVAGVELRAALANEDGAGGDPVPSNTFTPRRWALESRPLRVEPPPLVFDMAPSFLSRRRSW